MVTSGAMLKGASVYLYSLTVSTFFLIHHLKDLKVSDSYDFILQMGFAVNNFDNIDEDRLANKISLNYECKLYYICRYLLDFDGGETQSSCRGCRLKYCIAASPIPHICRLQNNLLP